MKIIAVDPGFERVGMAILEKKDKEEVLFSTCFKTSPREPHYKRILYIGQKIEELIQEFKPEVLAIETLLWGSNQKTALLVSEARGVILFESAKMGLSIREYSPLEIKMAVTGYGRSGKKEVKMMVEKLVKLKGNISSDDELDAIAIGLTFFARKEVDDIRKPQL